MSQPPDRGVPRGALSARLERQLRLEGLLQKMLSHRGVATSGRLQIISLAKVRRRAGKDWAGLRAIIFDCAERAIAERLTPQDFSMRFQDENFVLVFSELDGAAASEATLLIAKRIQEMLFQSASEPVRALAQGETIAVLKPGDFAVREGLISIRPQFSPAELGVPVVEVETDRPAPLPPDAEPDTGLAFRYQPIWEVKKDAITSFLCLAGRKDEQAEPIAGYASLFKGLSYSETVEADFAVFERVCRDLRRLEAENKQIMIVCPLHYDTLYRADSFARFTHLCVQLPEHLRKYLILFVWDPPAVFPVKDTFWFVHKLRRKLCRAAYVNVPAPYNLTHPAWQDSGIDGLSYIIDPARDEAAVMPEIDKFTLAAQKLGIRAAILNVSTLSIVSISVGFGADYLSGEVMASTLTSPDGVYRYKYDSMYK